MNRIDMLCNLIQTKTIETGRLVVYFHERFSSSTIDELYDLGYTVTTGRFIDYSKNDDFSNVLDADRCGTDWDECSDSCKYQTCVDLSQ